MNKESKLTKKLNPTKIKTFFLDGGYTEWTPFSPCTAKCVDEKGDRVRRRYCTNPTPQFGGLSCINQGLGPDRELLPCTGDKPRQSNDPTADCFSLGS